MSPLWLLPWLLGCKKRPPEDDFSDIEAAEDEVARNGRIVDGRFVDDALRFSIDVPAGWAAEPGPAGTALRVSLRHAAMDLRVEVWAYPPGDRDPRPREGCLWTFQDRGYYRMIRVADPVSIATCTAEDADAPRVLAWMVDRPDATFHFEVSLPSAVLIPGKEAVRGLFTTIRWDDGRVGEVPRATGSGPSVDTSAR